MGTDIHAVFQAKKDGAWVDVASAWEQHRHYFLFAWLADVRNGYGFAGVRTHEPIKPLLVEPRGLPKDFALVGEHEHALAPAMLNDWQRDSLAKWPDDCATADGAHRFWMGDHTHSWLTADEILSGQRPATTIRHGIITRDQYEAWDGNPETLPDSMCFDNEPGQVTVDARRPLPANATRVRISWGEPDGLQYFVDEVKRLKDEHGEVRMVFGFDS